MRKNRFETTDASTYQLLLDKAREMRKKRHEWNKYYKTAKATAPHTGNAVKDENNA